LFRNSERTMHQNRSPPFTIHQRNLLGIPNPIFIFKTKEASLETAPAGGAVACKQSIPRAPPTGRSIRANKQLPLSTPHSQRHPARANQGRPLLRLVGWASDRALSTAAAPWSPDRGKSVRDLRGAMARRVICVLACDRP
jgi:hypothetical protein